MVEEQQRTVVITIERTAVGIVTEVLLQEHRRFVRNQKQIIIQTVQQQGPQVLLLSVEANADMVRI